MAEIPPPRSDIPDLEDTPSPSTPPKAFSMFRNGALDKNQTPWMCPDCVTTELQDKGHIEDYEKEETIFVLQCPRCKRIEIV